MSKNFKSNDISLEEIMHDIYSGCIQLPDFQRNWVWDNNRIRLLISSMINEYPIGSVMFLENNIEQFNFAYRAFTNSEAIVKNITPKNLVLDGQLLALNSF